MFLFRLKNLTALFVALLFLFKATSVHSEESRLKDCPDEYKVKISILGGWQDERWSNCFGQWTDNEGQIYIGEFQGGMPNGQGLLKRKDGNSYLLSTFTEGENYGKTIVFNSSGKILLNGFIQNRKIINNNYVNYYEFDPRLTTLLLVNESNIQSEFNDCIKAGAAFYKLNEVDLVKSNGFNNSKIKEARNIGVQCVKFITLHKQNFSRLNNKNISCNINKIPSICDIKLLKKSTSSNNFVEASTDNIYENAFDGTLLNFQLNETIEGQANRTKIEEERTLELARKEDERQRELARKEDERIREVARRDAERLQEEKEYRAYINSPEYKKKLALEARAIKNMRTYVMFVCLDPYGSGLNISLAESLMQHASSGCNNCYAGLLMNPKVNNICRGFPSMQPLKDKGPPKGANKVAEVNGRSYYLVSKGATTLGYVGIK
ncbi:MAG: hypothetical protein K9J50_05450 [Sulfuritalea sp.]|nr:hypothetical protein [Sulfuritalea sp.]